MSVEMQILEEKISMMTVDEARELKEKVLEMLDIDPKLTLFLGDAKITIEGNADAATVLAILDAKIQFGTEAQQDRVMNEQIQQCVIDVVKAHGIKVFEISRYMWDYPDLLVGWRDGNPVFPQDTIRKEITVSPNGEQVEIEGYAEKIDHDDCGNRYRKRSIREEIGACDQHDLQTAKNILGEAFRKVVHWTEGDLTTTESL